MKVKLLPMLAVLAGSAHGAGSCQSSLTLQDVAAAMGPNVTLQPVFANQSIRGWRIYNARGAAQLEAQGITDGSLMTHICGKPANEIFRNEGAMCCDQDASIRFDVKLRVAGDEKTVIITR